MNWLLFAQLVVVSMFCTFGIVVVADNGNNHKATSIMGGIIFVLMIAVSAFCSVS